MRNRFRVLILLVALSSFPLAAEAAKPNYCLQALRSCFENCRSLIEPLSSACLTGCSIGYLSCGS
jgi:hypothetical protein